jgi:hypothetical protein
MTDEIKKLLSEAKSRQLNESEAMALYESGWWGDKTDKEIVRVQGQQERPCMPVGKFHAACESVLGVAVLITSFVNPVFIEALCAKVSVFPPDWVYALMRPRTNAALDAIQKNVACACGGECAKQLRAIRAIYDRQNKKDPSQAV